MNKLNLLFITFCLLLLAGCAKEFNDIDEYQSYIRGDDYPYYQTLTRDGKQISLRYMPTDAMMIQYYKNYITESEKIKKDTTLSRSDIQQKMDQLKKEIEEQKQSFENSLYFVLTIGFEDKNKDIIYDAMLSGFDNYSDWLQRLSFGMKEFIYLKTPKAGKIPLSLYEMERTFGMTKNRSLLLSFPREFNNVILNKEKNMKLVVEEFGLHTGRFVFDYKLPFRSYNLSNNLF